MSFSLNFNGELFDLSEPKVMAIVNLTSDSFYAPSRVSKKQLLNTVDKHIKEGAHIVDLGAFSSRPGAGDITLEAELNTLLPAIEIIRGVFPHIPISIDTYRSEVAQLVIDAGANMINDISGGDRDEKMFSTIAALEVPYIMMHMQGIPNSMQHSPQYSNVIIDVFKALSIKLDKLFRMGLKDVIIDPGFGFGKTIDHNFTLLDNLDYFAQLKCPILAGLSRKSMIYKTLKCTQEEALNGTSFCNTIALSKGASILRVHDVKPAIELITLHKKMTLFNG